MCSSGDSDAASEMVFIDAHVNHEGADPTQTPSPAQGRAVFFAKFPPTITPEEVENLFAKFGSVESVNLYRKWATAKASKGCGIVVFHDHDAAAAALEALDGKICFPNGGSTVAVEWLDLNKQKEQRPAAGSQKRRRRSSQWSTTGSRRPSFVHDYKRGPIIMQEDTSNYNTLAMPWTDRASSFEYALPSVTATMAGSSALYMPSACTSELIAQGLDDSCNTVAPFPAAADPCDAKLTTMYCDKLACMNKLSSHTSFSSSQFADGPMCEALRIHPAGETCMPGIAFRSNHSNQTPLQLAVATGQLPAPAFATLAGQLQGSAALPAAGTSVPFVPAGPDGPWVEGNVLAPAAGDISMLGADTGHNSRLMAVDAAQQDLLALHDLRAQIDELIRQKYAGGHAGSSSVAGQTSAVGGGSVSTHGASVGSLYTLDQPSASNSTLDTLSVDRLLFMPQQHLLAAAMAPSTVVNNSKESPLGLAPQVSSATSDSALQAAIWNATRNEVQGFDVGALAATLNSDVISCGSSLSPGGFTTLAAADVPLGKLGVLSSAVGLPYQPEIGFGELSGGVAAVIPQMLMPQQRLAATTSTSMALLSGSWAAPAAPVNCCAEQLMLQQRLMMMV